MFDSYQAVENMRQGMEPTIAAKAAIARIIDKYPKAQAAIVVADVNGSYGKNYQYFHYL